MAVRFHFLAHIVYSHFQVELEGPAETPYAGKYFLVKLLFGSDFPSRPPRGYFLTKIYHPNIDETSGAICVNTLKRDWTPATTLPHVLHVIRCLLIVPFAESSLNDEAGKLFMESYDLYFQRAQLLANVHGRTKSFKQNIDDEGKPAAAADCKEVSSQGENNADNGKNLKASSDDKTVDNNNKPRILQSSDNQAKKKKLIKKKSLKRL